MYLINQEDDVTSEKPLDSAIFSFSFFYSSPEIPLANVTKAHLVAYDPEKDFLPMIFAHCDYSLKVGEGTTIDFNWKCLERQVVDRFIRGRPRLVSLVNKLFDIVNMLYQV